MNMGKRRVWSRTGGEAPPGISELRPDVWRGDREPEENGLVVLGAPLGTGEFINAFAMKRRREEQLFFPLLALPHERPGFAERRTKRARLSQKRTIAGS